jgi:hypothetical protein
LDACLDQKIHLNNVYAHDSFLPFVQRAVISTMAPL